MHVYYADEVLRKEEKDKIVGPAVREAKSELVKLIMRIHADAISRDSFRVALHNLLMKIEGNEKDRA